MLGVVETLLSPAPLGKFPIDFAQPSRDYEDGPRRLYIQTQGVSLIICVNYNILY